MGQNLSRRTFLKKTAFGSLALWSSGFMPAGDTISDLPPGIAEKLQYFSPKEYLIMAAVGEQMLGKPDSGNPTAAELGVALRADKFLSGADPEVQEQFHQLLTVFNAPLFTFLFDFRFSSFIAMKPEDQISYLEDWMTSNLSFRRTAFQALKRTSLSMAYTEERSWKEIGFGGMDISQD